MCEKCHNINKTLELSGFIIHPDKHILTKTRNKTFLGFNGNKWK